MANTTVSVSTASTVIFTPTVASILEPQPITIYNNGAQIVYIAVGPLAATVVTGIPLASSGGRIDLTFIAASDVLRGITTTGTSEIRVMAMRA